MSKISERDEIKPIHIAAILSLFLFSGAGTFMNAAVQIMMDAWPEVSVQKIRLVTALPSLISIPFTIIIGAVVGKKLTYRFCALLGMGMILAAGTAPAFLPLHWTAVLLFRGIVGVGVGFLAIRNPLILASVPERKQAFVIGAGAAVMNGGAILAGPIVGLLASARWNYAFLYNLIAIFPLLLMVFFLKEPERNASRLQKASRNASESYSENRKMCWRIPYYIIVQFIMTAALYPLISSMSTYMAYKGIGTAVTAGTSNSIYNLFGVLACMAIAPLERKLKGAFLGVMSLLFAFGMGIIVCFPSVPTIFAGAALCGIAFNSMMAIYQLYNGRAADRRISAFSSALLIASLGLGNFMSVYYIDFCQFLFRRGSDVESTYLGSMTLYLLLAVVAFVCKPAPKELDSRTDRKET